MKQYIHEHENIVIGGTLEALEFAYASGYPLLCIPQKPHFFRPKSIAQWERLAFLLSLSGQLPLSDNLSSVRVDEEVQEIKCFTNNSRVIKFSYKTAHVIDDHSVDGLPLPSRGAKKEYLVFDWINVRRGGNHPYDYIEDEDNNFVKKLLFYPSRRIQGARQSRKDACGISLMTDKELHSLDYSESYTFLKARQMMEAAGLKGSRNGTQVYNGKPAYLSIKIEVSHREIIPLHKNEYEDTPTLRFTNSLDTTNILRYNKYLEHYLGNEDGRGKARGSQDPSREAQS